MQAIETDDDRPGERELIARRRAELGRFLRQRRSRVRPEAIGIASIGRRHVRGLRRDEVAAAANIGVSWYTMLEQGRIENVSARTLNSVAAALQLDAHERAHLHDLAVTSFEELDVDDAAPSAELHAFVRTFPLGGAFMHTSWGDLVAWNAWADELMRFSDRPGGANVLKLMLGDPSVAPHFIDPTADEIARRMLGHIRLRYGDVGGCRFEALFEELRAYPRFADLWAQRPIVAPPAEFGRIAHPVHGELDTTVTAFSSPSAPTYTIVLTVVADRVLPATSPFGAEQGPARVPDHGESLAWRRANLGAFLRQRRERMRPADVGIVPLGRRHAKGLRRDEVAARAGIGVSWYTMLEQGRVESVRPATLNAIGNALQLEPRERLYLRQLAARSFDELAPTIAQPRNDLLAFVRTFPLGSAYLHDARFDAIVWNARAGETFDFDGQDTPNVVRAFVETPGVRERFVAPDWTAVMRSLLGYVRLSCARSGDIGAASLVDELAARHPDVRRLWSDAVVAAPTGGRVTMRAPDGSLQSATLLVLVPSAAPTYTLILAVDDLSR